MKNNLMKVVAIVLAILMCLPISTSAFEEKKEDEEMLMRAEYTRKYQVTIRELYKLHVFASDYYTALDRGNPDELRKLAGDEFINATLTRLLGTTVGVYIAGMRALFDAARYEEVDQLKEATYYGMNAIKKAIIEYEGIEDWLTTDIIEVEVEFSVYNTWQNPDSEFISGGGRILRIHVRGGWISSGEVRQLIKEKQKEMMINGKEPVRTI